MQTAALTDGDGEGAGQQADGATEDVENQERESHPSTSFQHSRLRFNCGESIRSLQSASSRACEAIHGEGVKLVVHESLRTRDSRHEISRWRETRTFDRSSL